VASITGTARVRCPSCGLEQDCQLLQSINTRDQPEAKQRLLAGELNVHVCACGKRMPLAVQLLYHDPDASYFCHVVPGGDDAMAEATEAFRQSGAGGTQRLVPSLNALVEKVKLLDAGLDDRAIEMVKVLLLASLGDGELGRVLLFAARDELLLRWLAFDEHGEPRILASPLAAYERLAERTSLRPTRELRIDRTWAVEAVREMIAGAS
jgi:hypothetical protein